MRSGKWWALPALLLALPAFPAGDNCPPELQDEKAVTPQALKQVIDGGEHTYSRALGDKEALTSMLAPNPLTKMVASVFIGDRQPTAWDWSMRSAKLMCGVLAAWEETQDKKFLTYVKEWADHHLKAGLPPTDLRDGVAATVLLALNEETKDPRYLEAGKKTAADLLRLNDSPSGATASASTAETFCYSTYKDIVAAQFVSAPLLARMTELTGDRRYADLAGRAIVGHMDYLRFYRRENGPMQERKFEEEIFSHLLKQEGNRLFPNLDKRGDGWLYLCMGETFQHLPKDHPTREPLITFLRNQGFRSLEFSPMVLGAAAGSLKIQYSHSAYVYGAAELLAVKPVDSCAGPSAKESRAGNKPVALAR